MFYSDEMQLNLEYQCRQSMFRNIKMETFLFWNPKIPYIVCYSFKKIIWESKMTRMMQIAGYKQLLETLDRLI